MRKTVVFVTHDIEEAVRLGDRIAVMRQGGHLEQYDTPADLLGNPATDVRRGLRRRRPRAQAARCDTDSGTDDLEHPPVVHLDDAAAEAARRRCAAVGARWAVVLDDRDGLHGWVSASTG